MMCFTRFRWEKAMAMLLLVLGLTACSSSDPDVIEKPEPEIIIPEESQEFFANGVELSPEGGSQDIYFTATDDWTASAEDTMKVGFIYLHDEQSTYDLNWRTVCRCHYQQRQGIQKTPGHATRKESQPRHQGRLRRLPGHLDRDRHRAQMVHGRGPEAGHLFLRNPDYRKRKE